MCESEVSEWRGFKRHDFKLNGVNCIIVEPEKPLPGRPWLWRARFFNSFAWLDEAMVRAGYYLVYINVVNLFGGPEALRRFDMFYDYLTREKGFNAKTVLEGFSRGGLIVYRWAAKNPEKVACIYADAPVCDFRSWPGGKGVGPGVAECWELCLKSYSLTEEEAMKFNEQPIDLLKPLADAEIPIMHVCGDQDQSVPMSENTDVLEARYKALGGDITVVHKVECGHHPHSLEDPSVIVDFIRKNYI